MGLCKCPKRKVTNLFCFEHRVNVCEHCLVDNHSKCIVQSYLNWLKDSDYNPYCPLCGVLLTEGEVLRLLCYDVFHLHCLDKHYRSLPPSTAPAGYRCYTCDAPLFPTENQAGYVTKRLREVLSKYNWARVGLCLPLIDEPNCTNEDIPEDHISNKNCDVVHGTSTIESHVSLPEVNNFPSLMQSPNNSATTYSTSSNPWNSFPNNAVSDPSTSPSPSSTILLMDQLEQTDVDKKAVSRKMLADALPPTLANFPSQHDPDGKDKYKRRPAWSWFKRWLQSRMLRGRNFNDGKTVPRKLTVLLILLLMAFLTVIVFATQVGHRSNKNDPNFDPMLNPNIHVAERRILPPNFDQDIDMKDNLADPLQVIKPVLGK